MSEQLYCYCMASEDTLCGWAHDVFETESLEDGPGRHIEVARPGQRITCPDCKTIIAAIKKVKHWKMPLEGPHG